MPEPDDTIKLADDHAEGWQSIRTLPPSQAQVIALHCYEDYSIGQIAAALGRAPGAPSRPSSTRAAAGSPSPGPPARRLLLTPQRLALVVNLLLVVVLVGVAATTGSP